MAAKTKQARALIDINQNGIKCRCGNVFEAPEKVVRGFVAAGMADDDADAVAAGLLDHALIVVPVEDDDLGPDLEAAASSINEAAEKLQTAVKSAELADKEPATA